MIMQANANVIHTFLLDQPYGPAHCIDPDQPAQSAQTDPGRHIPSQGG